MWMVFILAHFVRSEVDGVHEPNQRFGLAREPAGPNPCSGEQVEKPSNTLLCPLFFRWLMRADEIRTLVVR